MLADISVEHSTWASGPNTLNHGLSEASERDHSFVRRLELLFDRAAVIDGRDCYTAEVLAVLKKNTWLGVGAAFACPGQHRDIHDAVALAHRNVRDVVARIKAHMQQGYRSNHKLLNTFSAFCLPSPFLARAGTDRHCIMRSEIVRQEQAADAARTSSLFQMSAPLGLDRDAAVQQLSRILPRAGLHHGRDGSSIEASWGRASVEHPNMLEARKLVSVFGVQE